MKIRAQLQVWDLQNLGCDHGKVPPGNMPCPLPSPLAHTLEDNQMLILNKELFPIGKLQLEKYNWTTTIT
jgi:hypothetical protein